MHVKLKKKPKQKTGQLGLIRSPLDNKMITRNIFRQSFLHISGLMKILWEVK